MTYHCKYCAFGICNGSEPFNIKPEQSTTRINSVNEAAMLHTPPTVLFGGPATAFRLAAPISASNQLVRATMFLEKKAYEYHIALQRGHIRAPTVTELEALRNGIARICTLFNEEIACSESADEVIQLFKIRLAAVVDTILQYLRTNVGGVGFGVGRVRES